MNNLTDSKENLSNLLISNGIAFFNPEVVTQRTPLSDFRKDIIVNCMRKNFNMKRDLIHNLTTLYTYTNKFSKGLMENFQLLEEYCTSDKTDLNVGIKSLKHAIYSLRYKIEKKELESLFFQILCEAAALKKENNLYENVFVFKSIKPYAELIDTLKIDISTLPIERVGDWKMMINDNQINISSKVFRELPDMDGVITYDENRDSISIDFNYRSKLSKEIQFLKALADDLNERGENWIVDYPKDKRSIKRIGCGSIPGIKGKTSLKSMDVLNYMDSRIEMCNK